MHSFGDLNDMHLKAAQSLGIRPLASREEVERMKEKLVQIRNNEHYSVDSLTHSIPFLIPRAGALLDTIGVNFLDSLTSKGLNPNQIVVTSVLRTEFLEETAQLMLRYPTVPCNDCKYCMPCP